MNYFSKIIGVGSYVPTNVVTNFDLEKIMDTSDEWIQQRTGIVKRHWASSEQATSDLAVEAANKALMAAGMDKNEIDMVIFATLSPDHDFPGAGCFFQAKMDLPEIAVLDIRQQCSGFLYGLSIADNFIRTGAHKNILLIGAEIHSKGLDKTPQGRNVSVLFGDGAGAVVLTRAEVNDQSIDPHIISTDLFANGRYAKELWLSAPGSAVPDARLTPAMLEDGSIYPQMNGKTVFVHATKKMSECLSKSLNDANKTVDDVDVFLFHQANLRINQKVAEFMQIPQEKVFNTIQDYANTTAATIPLGMDKAIEAGVLKPGMLVASAAFGSGFTWASALWRY